MHADVCVVGAGPAGLTLAHELAGSGLSVLILEAGPSSPPPAGVDVTSTRNVGLPYALQDMRCSGVGGSSLRWHVETPLGRGFVRLKELDEHDFERRDVMPASGWPISRADLAPHYRRARSLLGLPQDEGLDGPVHGVLERRRYSFARATVFTEDIPELLRRRPDVTVVGDCAVTEVCTAEGSGEVSHLLCRTGAGEQLTARARVFVLAGGAIENARLLLASRSDNPAGLGNSHDLVGRYFMEHPHYFSAVVLPRAGPVLDEDDARWDLSAQGGQVRQDEYALAAGVVREQGLFNAAFKVRAYSTSESLGFGHDGSADQAVVDAFLAARSSLRTRSAGALSGRDAARLAVASPQLIAYGARRLSERRRGARTVHSGFRVLVMAEQEPSPHSRVRLVEEPDRFGVPKAELDWRLTRSDTDSMVRSQRLAAAALGTVVGGRVVSTLGPEGVPTPGGGAHHVGTTRMSTSPSRGVVDEHCKVHGVRNLYVAGSSVFPTGGAANPTLTIVALASRLALHLQRHHVVDLLSRPPG